MKVLFWVLAILAMAVALTLAAKHNAGYLLLVYPPYRMELSLNLMITLLLAVFFLAYGLLRLGARAFNLPVYVRTFKKERRRGKGRAAMREGLLEFAAGHYDKAEKLAAKALELGEELEINALIAARSAHALGAFDRRDAYLAQAGKACSDYPDTGMAG